MFYNYELCVYLIVLKYYFYIKWYNGIYGIWLFLYNLYLLVLFMKYWVIDIFMILLEDCLRVSFIELRYGKLYKFCIKFGSMCWVYKYNMCCVFMGYICIKLVNFIFKILVEFKKMKLKFNGILY